MQTLLFSSLTVYLANLIGADAPVLYRLKVIATDFLFIGAAGALFGAIAIHRQWILAGITGAILALGIYVFGFRWQVFPHRNAIPLDKQGELLIELKPGEGPEGVLALSERYGLRVERAFFPNDSSITDLDAYYVVDIPDRQSSRIARIRQRLERNKAVVWVEENEQVQVSPLPAKTLWNTGPDTGRYGLNDPGIGNLWAFRQMAMEKLYQALQNKNVKPSKKALVAILDTGVDAGHEDLRANYQSLKTVYDNDPKGHGTHCAGIAAAVSNNGLGIASFSRNNAFYAVTSVKVLGAGGIGTQKTIIEGMIFAADQGADVLSMSLGGPSNQQAQRAYQKAVAYAAAKGAIVVAAAGNSNRNAREFSPANTPGLLCVSAVDASLTRATFSNYVSDLPMAVAAPGVDIYSTVPGNQYASYSGTSMAAPQVAGLLGLMKSLRPDLNAAQAFELLDKTGIATKDTRMTGRFVQPGAAINRLLER